MKDMLTQQAAVTNISSSNREALVTINHIPSDSNSIALIFQTLADHNINIDMISQSAPIDRKVNISFSLQDEDLFTVLKTLKSFKADYEDLRIDINSNNVKISLFGEGMKTTPGTAAKTMELLAQNDIDIQLITTSEVDISYLISASDKDKAIKCFKEYFNI